MGLTCLLLLLIPNERFILHRQLTNRLDISVDDTPLDTLWNLLAQVQCLQVGEVVNLRLVHACPGGARFVCKLDGAPLGVLLLMLCCFRQLLLL